MKTFIVNWLDCKQETLMGDSISDALIRAGYREDVMTAIESYQEVKESWNKDEVIELIRDLADHIDELYRPYVINNVIGYSSLPKWIEENISGKVTKFPD